MTERTTVHLLRHGEVHNPEGLLYGRLPDYHLSDLGRQMADRAAEVLAGRDIAVVTASPLERAQETAQPTAAAFDLSIGTDPDLIEAGNIFEGTRVGVGDGILKQPASWRHLWNPMRPSWGEPYAEIAARMRRAIRRARDEARGQEALLVSHQLPIWVTRLDAEDRNFAHDPRKRQCNLASLTSFTFDGDRFIAVSYTEPAADLAAKAAKAKGA
ncbi:MAG: histidine phosphatase family protein [Candidatus Nanopelagicales bacterium]